MNVVEINHENGHYVGYVNGKAYCTGDTYQEVVQDLTGDGYL